MTRKRVAAVMELLMAATLFAWHPTKLLDHEEFHPEPEDDPALPPAVRAAPNTDPVVEPKMFAVNGYLLVSFLDQPPRRFYVARSPDHVAEQLRAAVAAGQSMFSYWDRPGERTAKEVWIACAMVTDVTVQHLEPDLDALWDSESDWSYVL